MIAFYRSGAWFLAAALLAASSVRAQPSLPPSPPPAPPPTETTSKPATVNVSAPSPAPTTTVVNVGKAIEEACKGCTDKNECSSVAQSYCDTIKKEKAAGAAPSDDCEDPTSACYASYWRRRGIDPDELLKGKNPNKHDLELALARAEQTSAGPELLLVAIGGLQSFLEERAKAEALDYAIEQLEGRLCNDRYRTYLAATCKLLEGSDVNLDQATLVRLQKAVVKDLARLPKSLIRSLPPSEDPNELAFRAFGIGASDTVFELVTNKLPPEDLPKTWAEKDRAAYQDESIVPAAHRLTCSARSPAAPMDSACYALLLPELGSAAANVMSSDPSNPSAEQIAVVIEATAQSFCTTYAPTGQTANGACLLGSPDQPSAVLEELKRLARASFRFVRLGKRAKQLAADGMPVVEITEKLLPDLADAFDDWRRALEKVLDAARARTKNPLRKKSGSVTNAWSVAENASFAKVAPGAKNLSFASTTLVAQAAPPASTKPAAASAPSATSAAWIGCIFHAASAVASREYSELLAAIAEAFEAGQPFEKVKPSSQAMAAIGFVVRLASARKPEDAKKLFEEEAAPLGTYKVKYDREGVTIAVNAFVGPFVARGKQFSVKDDTHYGLVVRPLSAPIGLDFTLASGKYCHFGFHGAVIDPFGVGTIDPEGEATDLDWGAIVTPSLFARFGIGGSPFTVLGGVVWQPLAKSSESCANAAGESAPCWKGSLQFGGALAVDVPLLVLH